MTCRALGVVTEEESAIAVHLTVLGSGSGGNATLVASSETRVLIDVGLSYREVCRRLKQVGVDPAGIGSIVITHAHGDHTRGARLFSRRHAVPIYTTETIRAEWGAADVSEWRMLTPNRYVTLDDLRFYPFTVPHDARQTVAFQIETLSGTVGFATDIGEITAELIERFRDCRVLVLESNHATELLRVSPYAASTRARIGSTQGHLSNEALAAFVRRHLGASVRCIVLAHLSRVNNVPEIAEMTCREALANSGRRDVKVIVSRQERVTPTVDLSEWSPAVPVVRAAPAQQVTLPFLKP